jgi:hypothetical protein
LTVIVVPAQVRVTDAGALEATAQFPGPCRGTSAASNVGLSCPLTAPLEALAADAFTLDLTFESVATEELLTRLTLVVGTITVRDFSGTVRCAVVRSIVRLAGAVVVGSAIVVGGVLEALIAGVVGVVTDSVSRWRAGVELDEAVHVKTRTKRRTGLDHTTQCVLLRACGSLISVL